MATAEEAAAEREQIEEQARVVYAAALLWIATHGGGEEPDDDHPLAKASATLAVLLWRSMRRQYKDLPRASQRDREAWTEDYTRAVTRRALEDAREHYKTVSKRVRRDEPDATDQTVSTTFKGDSAWSDAAARTMATRLAAETAMSMKDDVDGATGTGHSLMWISQGDPKVRTLHRRLHGRVRPAGTPFHTWPDGESLSYPGDPKAPLDATINCRCALFLVPTKDAKAAEATFEVDDEDFDVPLTAAAAQVRSWERERARREWFLELGLRRS